MNNKNLVEYLIGKLVLLILEGIIGAGLVIGFFWIVGTIVSYAETHIWAFVVIAIVGIISVLKLVSECD